MGCKHHFVFTQGYFYCSKCGKRSYGRTYKKRRGRKIWIPIVIIFIIGIAYVSWSEPTFLAIPLYEFDKISESIQKEGKNFEINLGEGVESESSPQDSQKQIKLPPVTIPEIIPQKSQSELYQYAVEQINKDRLERGLSHVVLSNNRAAQIHADDILKQGTISHWLSNGEKPYVTYTKNGGAGYVAQNVATSQCIGFCTGYDLEKEIRDHEHALVYNDADSDWGHRDNIIDPHHTHVSLGIAHNNNMFVLVQNFEDNYFDGYIQSPNSLVQINGKLREGKIYNIGIYYDPLPTPALYQLHKNDNFYEMGDFIAVVDRPLPPNQYYEQPADYQLIVAKNWNERGQNILIDFDASQVFSRAGVYTIGIWLENKGDTFLITSYSIVRN